MTATAATRADTDIKDIPVDAAEANMRLSVDDYLEELLRLVEPLTAIDCSASEPGCGLALDESYPTVAAVASDGGVPFVAALESESELASWLDQVAGTFDLIVLAADLRTRAATHLWAILLESAGGRIRQLRMEPAELQAWGVWRGGTPIVVLPPDMSGATIS